MPITAPKIDHVIYDPALKRFEADVSFSTETPLRRKVHVSIPGHVSWGHQRMVSELVAAGQKALSAR